jgi:hypothetical protein
MNIGNITSGQQTVTATGAVTPAAGLDISGITGDFTIHLRVQGLSVGNGVPLAQIQVEDSLNAFGASMAHAEAFAYGKIDPNAEECFSWRKYQVRDLRAGTAGAVLRFNVVGLNPTSFGPPSLTLDGWIEF